MTLGQVKSVQNFCLFGQQRVLKGKKWQPQLNGRTLVRTKDRESHPLTTKIENVIPAWGLVAWRRDDDELPVGGGPVGEGLRRRREGQPAHRAGVGGHLVGQRIRWV